uniref:KH type-2 domain-containing protein n=1 Tax=Electrophorus electricus TaxID=8005 RepID=A0A4W4HL88_ELEEL
MAVQISKKRKFVSDGIFKAELNEFLTRELAEDGYSGVEVRVTPTRTEIIILATRTQNVLGEKGRRIRELTAVVQKRFGFPEGSVEGLLRRPALHHGEWGQGLRGRCLWQAQGSESQVHEVCGWADDPQWRPRQLLRRHCRAPCPAPTG